MKFEYSFISIQMPLQFKLQFALRLNSPSCQNLVEFGWLQSVQYVSPGQTLAVNLKLLPANQVLPSFRRFYINVHLLPFCASVRIDANSDVDDGDPVDSELGGSIEHFLHDADVELLCIDGEVVSVHHVIDISPDCVQRELALDVAVVDGFQFIRARVAVSALMEPFMMKVLFTRRTKMAAFKSHLSNGDSS